MRSLPCYLRCCLGFLQRRPRSASYCDAPCLGLVFDETGQKRSGAEDRIAVGQKVRLRHRIEVRRAKMATDWLFYWMTLPSGLAGIALAVALPFLFWRLLLAKTFGAIGYKPLAVGYSFAALGLVITNFASA